MTEDERIDPARAQRWFCARGGLSTIVVAVSQDEAKALAAHYFAKATSRPSSGERWAVVRPASDEDAARWLRLRRQDQAGPRALRSGAAS